ncbi:hypothetical protein [Ureibacillus thermophilus]
MHQFKYWLRKIENPIKNQGNFISAGWVAELAFKAIM